jgi:hypothetical protein
MALTVVVELSFTATGVTLTDATGAYDVTSNPTGYGSPNAAFADYAHYAILRKKNVNEVADEDLDVTAYDETSATAFSATRSVDGWHQGVKLNIPVWTAGTYASGTVKYYNGVIYQANTSTSQQPPHANWDIISDLTDIEGHTSIITTTINNVTAYNADVYWSQQIALLSQQGMCGICEDSRKRERLERIRNHITAVLVADIRDNNTDGEWNALALISLGAFEA